MHLPPAICLFLFTVTLLSVLPNARCTNAAGLIFLKENALQDGVTVLPSGLQYMVIIDGSGHESPFSNTSCLVHYAGSLIDGTEFDSSYKRGKPSVVEPRSMTKGFHEALLLMTEGSKWQIALPSDLAFGELGFHPYIKQGDAVVFELQLLRLLERGSPRNVSASYRSKAEPGDYRPALASFTVILLIVLPLALCIHRLVLKRRNLHSLFVRSDFNMPSMRAPFSPGSFGGKNGEYSVLPLFETSVATSPKADHQA